MPCSAVGADGAKQPVESRKLLLNLSIGLVEDLRERGSREKGPEGFGVDFQICLPYRGLFVWSVAGDDVVGDPNQVVFVTGGEPYRMSAPLAEGYAELIVTPRLDVLSEIAHSNGTHLDQHPLFRRRTWRVTPGLQILRARLLHWAAGAADVDPLESEELVIRLLRLAVANPRQGPSGARTAKLIRRTKEFLEGQLSSRMRLVDVGRAVGASPAYLTDVFSRVEGLSLHAYLTQLRLARALVELPNTHDLTTLAFDVGFSSHSHFSATFRRAFGCTPSEFRNSTRTARVPRRGSGISRRHEFTRTLAQSDGTACT